MSDHSSDPSESDESFSSHSDEGLENRDPQGDTDDSPTSNAAKRGPGLGVKRKLPSQWQDSHDVEELHAFLQKKDDKLQQQAQQIRSLKQLCCMNHNTLR